MRTLAALCGALLLTLVMAAPAAALQKMLMEDISGHYWWEEPVVGEYWGWECSEPIWFGGEGTSMLWLWYENDVDPADITPDGRAWHWVKGVIKDRGIMWIRDEGGRQISGKVDSTTHMSDHHLGDPYPFDVLFPDVDLETWKMTFTGKSMAIHVPGYKPLYHEAGQVKGTATVIMQVHQPDGDWIMFEPDARGWRGNDTYDDAGVCEYFGYDYVPYVEP
jgi:hypothetical protein